MIALLLAALPHIESPSRERALVATKLEEALLWWGRCKRDWRDRRPPASVGESESLPT